jgi:hypothetical protein
MATTKKSMWIHSQEVIDMMQTYLPGKGPEYWTMKRLMLQMIAKYTIPHRKTDNARLLARTIDFWIAQPPGTEGSIDPPVQKPNVRWSAKLDMARLLQLMFGDEKARANYQQSRQLATRERLDDTTLRSIKVEYWVDVAQQYNNSDTVVNIDVDNDIVSLHLKAHLSTTHRVAWPATKLRTHFMNLRADYEGSIEYQNYKASGQNSDLFYPDFNDHNPTHVMLHYFLRMLPHDAVLGDLPKDACVDTDKPTEDHEIVDMCSSNDTSGEDQPAKKPTKRRLHDQISRRKRSRPNAPSPASSIASSASKRSRSRSSRGRSTASEGDATKTFRNACDKIIESFDQMAKQSRAKSQRSINFIRCHKRI